MPHSARITLFRRRKFWHLNYWLDGKRIKEPTGLTSKGEAELIRADREKSLVLGQLHHFKRKDVPVYRCYRDYLRDARTRFKADKTITTDRYVLKSFFRWASLKTIDLFRTKTVMEYMAYKVKVDKLVVTSIRRLREALHAFFNFVKRCGHIGENPVTDYKAPKAPEREIRFLSLRQIEVCLKGIAGHLLEPLIACAIFAGLRREELCWLTWDDVDLNEKKPLIKVRAKTIDGTPRKLPTESRHPRDRAV